MEDIDKRNVQEYVFNLTKLHVVLLYVVRNLHLLVGFGTRIQVQYAPSLFSILICLI